MYRTFVDKNNKFANPMHWLGVGLALSYSFLG